MARQLRHRCEPGPAGSSCPEFKVEAHADTATGPVDVYVALRGVTGPKTNTPRVETPQSIFLVTHQPLALALAGPAYAQSRGQQIKGLTQDLHSAAQWACKRHASKTQRQDP